MDIHSVPVIVRIRSFGSLCCWSWKEFWESVGSVARVSVVTSFVRSFPPPIPMFVVFMVLVVLVGMRIGIGVRVGVGVRTRTGMGMGMVPPSGDKFVLNIFWTCFRLFSAFLVDDD